MNTQVKPAKIFLTIMLIVSPLLSFFAHCISVDVPFFDEMYLTIPKAVVKLPKLLKLMDEGQWAVILLIIFMFILTVALITGFCEGIRAVYYLNAKNAYYKAAKCADNCFRYEASAAGAATVLLWIIGFIVKKQIGLTLVSPDIDIIVFSAWNFIAWKHFAPVIMKMYKDDNEFNNNFTKETFAVVMLSSVAAVLINFEWVNIADLLKANTFALLSGASRIAEFINIGDESNYTMLLMEIPLAVSIALFIAAICNLSKCFGLILSEAKSGNELRSGMRKFAGMNLWGAGIFFALFLFINLSLYKDLEEFTVSYLFAFWLFVILNGLVLYLSSSTTVFADKVAKGEYLSKFYESINKVDVASEIATGENPTNDSDKEIPIANPENSALISLKESESTAEGNSDSVSDKSLRIIGLVIVGGAVLIAIIFGIIQGGKSKEPVRSSYTDNFEDEGPGEDAYVKVRDIDMDHLYDLYDSEDDYNSFYEDVRDEFDDDYYDSYGYDEYEYDDGEDSDYDDYGQNDYFEYYELVPSWAGATSTLAADSLKDYEASNVLDGNLDTVWSEGVDGTGIGEYIQIDFSTPVVIDCIELWLGNQGSQKLMDNNSMPTRMFVQYCYKGDEVLSCNYQTDNVYEVGDIYTMADDVTAADSVILVITDTRPGNVWQDTCITDIKFYGHYAD